MFVFYRLHGIVRPRENHRKVWSLAQNQALCFLPERIPWHEDLRRVQQTSLLFSGLPEKGLVAFRPGSGSQELVQGQLLRRGCRLEGSRCSWQRTWSDCAQGHPSTGQSCCGSILHLGRSQRRPKARRYQNTQFISLLKAVVCILNVSYTVVKSIKINKFSSEKY